MRLRLIMAGLVVASCLATSCGGLTDPANNTNEQMVLNVPAGGLQGKSFQVSKSGEYFVTLNSLTPPLAGNLPTHVQLTAQAGGTCAPNIQIVSETFSAVAGKQVLSGIFPLAGTFCLFVMDDQRTFPGDEVASLTINHP